MAGCGTPHLLLSHRALRGRDCCVDFPCGEGIFGEHATKIADAKSLDPHRALGSLLGLVAVVLFLLALAARANRSTVIRTLILAVLALVAQPALAGGGEHTAWVGGFHVIDGIIILGLSAQLAFEAHRRPAPERAPS